MHNPTGSHPFTIKIPDDQAQVNYQGMYTCNALVKCQNNPFSLIICQKFTHEKRVQ